MSQVTSDLQVELRDEAHRGNLQALMSLHKQLKNQPLQAGPASLKNALHRAAEGGHDRVVSYLLKATKNGMLDVNAQDREGNTALHLIAQAPNIPITKRIAIVTLLLAHGANPLVENAQHKTPLMNLVPLRDRIVSDYPHLYEGMNGIISKIKMWIYDRANALNRTVTIGLDGEVNFDKTGIPLQDPRSYLLETTTTSLYRGLGMANS